MPFWTPGPCMPVFSRMEGRNTKRPSASARPLHPEITSCTSESAVAVERRDAAAPGAARTARDLCTLLLVF